MFIAVVKEVNFKNLKTSPGPVAAMAARSPGGARARAGQAPQAPKTTVTSFALDPCKASFQFQKAPET
jgi:hypothetical protein